MPDQDAMRPSEDGVSIVGSAAVQVGSHNTQHNNIYFYGPGTWTSRPPRRPVPRSPYRGLSAFEEEDQDLFFGREAAIEQVMARLSDRAQLGKPDILVVSGVSGAGKSSLLHAGMLPRLRRDGLADAPSAASWPCLLLTPGRSPLDELAAQVSAIATGNADDTRRTLTDHPGQFALLARQAVLAQREGNQQRAGRERLLLIIDQFEQVFTQCPDEGERRAFVRALCSAAAGPDPAALVVLGIRADFEARCAEYSELATAIQDRYLLTGMSERDLVLAISQPAKLAGAHVDAELTDRLLREIRASRPAAISAGTGTPAYAGAGVLPLLSYALAETWRLHTGPDLTLVDYHQSGGIETAVATAAQRAFDTLTSTRQETARQVFLQLTASSADGTDTAVPATRAELDAGKNPDDVQAVLDAFAAERLLTLTTDGAEISHEVLLAAWPLLRDTWLEETRADRVLRTRLRDAARDWTARPHDRSYLWSGTLLASVTAAAGRIAGAPGRLPPLSADERSFVSASQRAARRGRRRRQATAIASVLILAVAAVAIVVIRDNQAATAAERAIAASGRLAAQSLALGDSDPVLARLEAVAAYRLNQSSPQARYAMRAAAVLHELAVLPSPVQQVSSVAFSPDGSLLATLSSGGNQLRLWDTATRLPVSGPVTIPSEPGQYGPAMAFSRDSTRLAVAAGAAHAQLWDIKDKHLHFRADLPACGSNLVDTVAFNPDDSTLAVGSGSPDGRTSGCLQLFSGAGPRPAAPPLKGIGPVHAVVFSPDGKTLAAAVGTGRGDSAETMLWHAGRHSIASIGTFVGSLAFSPDGRHLAIAGVRLKILDMPSGHQVFASPPVLPLADVGVSFGAVAYSPHGSILATTLYGGVRLWDAAAHNQLATLDADSATEVHSAAFSPDGAMLAIAVHNGTELWDVPASAMGPTESLPTLFGHGGDNAQFSSDSRTLTVDNDNDGTAQRWSLTGRVPRPFGPTFPIPESPTPNSIHVRLLSPDGKVVAVGGESGTQLWNVATHRKVGPFLPSDHFVTAMAFSPDGKTLAISSYGNTTQLWDVASGQPLGPALPGAASLVFSRDGSVLAQGTELWDVPTSQRIGTIQPGAGDFLSVAFSPDGTMLAIVTGAGEPTQLWNVGFLAPAHAADYLCGQAKRTLSHRQWALYAPGIPYRNVCPSNPLT